MYLKNPPVVVAVIGFHLSERFILIWRKKLVCRDAGLAVARRVTFSASAMPSNAVMLKRFVAVRQFLFGIGTLMPLHSENTFKAVFNRVKAATTDIPNDNLHAPVENSSLLSSRASIRRRYQRGSPQ